MPDPTKYELDFRPKSYWGQGVAEITQLANIKGAHRKLAALKAYREGGMAAVDAMLRVSKLSDVQRDHVGKIHPQLMGGEYLPDFEKGEVEIARISMNSTTADVIAVWAKRGRGCIRYRIVDEYKTEFGFEPESSKTPLSMRELIELMDGVTGDNLHRRGLVAGCLFEYDTDFLTVTSEFYPELGRWYKDAVKEWRWEWGGGEPEDYEDCDDDLEEDSGPPDKLTRVLMERSRGSLGPLDICELGTDEAKEEASDEDPDDDSGADDAETWKELGRKIADLTGEQWAGVFSKFVLETGPIFWSAKSMPTEMKLLYEERVLPNLNEGRRLALAQYFLEEVERGKGNAMAFLPLICGDPSSQVVSTASLNLGMLLPLEDDDPLTGPKFLKKLVESGDKRRAFDGADLRKADVLCGMLLLGDRRMRNLVRGSWRLLEEKGRRRLGGATSGFVSTLQVDFYLDWLDEAEDSDFLTVCGALEALPVKAVVPVVVEIERRFPLRSDGNKPPITEFNRWDFPAYGRAIRPRLEALIAAGRQPEAVRRVIEAWEPL